MMDSGDDKFINNPLPLSPPPQRPVPATIQPPNLRLTHHHLSLPALHPLTTSDLFSITRGYFAANFCYYWIRFLIE